MRETKLSHMASTATTAIRARVAVDARANEHRIRRAAGWLLNYAGIQVIVGVAWDSTWHYSVGRDSFLYVPSHMLLYTGTALAGIVGGRSIGRMWQTAATSESRSMLSWPFARGPALARDPFGRRSR